MEDLIDLVVIKMNGGTFTKEQEEIFDGEIGGLSMVGWENFFETLGLRLRGEHQASDENHDYHLWSLI